MWAPTIWAATFFEIGGQSGNDWNTASVWSGGAPTAGNEYVSTNTDSTVTVNLFGVPTITGRVRATDINPINTFAGGTLTLSNNSELLMKQTGTDTASANIVIKGGTIRSAANSLANPVLTGSLSVVSNSYLMFTPPNAAATPAAFTISSSVSGSKALTLLSSLSSGVATNNLTFLLNGDWSGFTGTLILENSSSASTNGICELNPASGNMSGTMLQFYRTTFTTLILDTGVTVDTFTIGVSVVPVGTYTPAQLAALNLGGTFSGAGSLTVLSAFSAPTSLTATSGDSQVALSWSAVSGAVSYNVMRATVNGGPYTSIATPTSVNYTDTTAVDGTTYYYVVAAVNSAAVQTGNSPQASATPVGVPSGLVAATSVSVAQVNLSWTAAAGATSYNVKRATVSGGPYTTIGTSSTAAYTDVAVISGTTYYYVVSAVSSGSESANSSEADATPSGPPLAPTNVVGAPENAQGNLWWTGSFGATSYNLYRSTVNGSGYTLIGNTSAATYTDPGLTFGTTYYYVVTAVGAGGTSANSPQASILYNATLNYYSDSSSNYVSGWSSGTTGGTGFQAWSLYSNNHGNGYAGCERTTTATTDTNIVAGDGSVWKLYAIDFVSSPQQEEAIAYRVFTSPLQAPGDGFGLSLRMQKGNSGIGNAGGAGFALRHGNTTGSGNQAAGARLQVYLGGNSVVGGTTVNSVTVVDASGTNTTTVANVLGEGDTFSFQVVLGGPNTYSLVINRSCITNADGSTTSFPAAVVTGALAGSGTIDSFSMFNCKNSVDNGMNSDAYFNALTYQNVAPFTCPTLILGNLGNPLMGTPYSFSITAAGGVAPYSFRVSSGSLPTSLTLSSAGTLAGTPTVVGSYSFTVTATDANSCSSSRSYALTVQGSGADSSANYASWTSGTDAGAGFGAWSVYYNYHGEGYCGYEKTTVSAPNIAGSDGSVFKLYAINFSSDLHQEEATAYRRFNAPLSVAGDEFFISFEASGSVGNPGQIGFALRNGDITGSNSSITNGSNNRAALARLQVYLTGGSTNLMVEDASGPRPIPGVGYTSFGYDTKVTLTGPNTYSLVVTRYNGAGTFDAPVTVTGTLAGSGPIDSFAMFSWKNSTDNGANGDAYFNNIGYTSSTQLITNNVTFQVDMSVQTAVSNFIPGETVEVRGSFDDWAVGVHMLTNNPSLSGNASNIYNGVVTIVGATNSGSSYKFVMNNPGATYENSLPKTSTPDTGADDHNRFFALTGGGASTLPAVLFSDLEANDYPPADTTVTFSVNMNGAVLTSGSNFVAGSDTVWINGDFVPWYAWYNPVNPVAGNTAYELSPVGGGIYSITLTIPRGTGVAFAYKYGVAVAASSDLGPRDNEAPAGTYHYRVIRSTATGSYTMPQDTFGFEYHEPFFQVGSQSAAQLTIGTPSGGTTPVSWLGRPGAHLQAATNISGPWTDYWNTDGTNWTSGVNTANGLMSVTNWPSVGNSFFRVVKP